MELGIRGRINNMRKDKKKESNQSQIILYTTPDGDIKIDTILQDETIWLNQSAIAELFDVKIPAVSKHLKNIFESGELDKKVVVSILENTTKHGAIEGKTQKKEVKYYNLDVVIAVGYRVNSKRATQFRSPLTSASQTCSQFAPLYKSRGNLDYI